MTTSGDLLIDAFDRIRQNVHDVVDGLSPEALAVRIDEGANSIAWLVWHLTRIQDDHVADIAGTDEVWIAQDWTGRFELPFSRHATGYGHSPKDVAAVGGITGEALVEYHDAVHEQTVTHIRTLDDADYARVVDRNWVPAVTLGVRLISVVSDDLQHVGQAAFIKGWLLRP
ncbi:DinB family protein [Streptomyces sp. NPDC058653]|uniref:mycothiol transferase n=1 Tax=Streptomyces sp. NPDC058653 TaxID=3346576 RepID=UPI00365BE254